MKSIKFTYEQLVDFLEDFGGLSIRCNDEESFVKLLKELAKDGNLEIEK